MKAYVFQEDGFCTAIVITKRREKFRLFSEDETSIARTLYNRGLKKDEHYDFSPPSEDIELNPNFTLINPQFLGKEREKRFKRSLAQLKRY